MIRTIFVLLFVVIFLVPVGIPLLFIFWLLGKAFPDAMDRASLSVIQWVLRVIMLLSGVRLTVLGRENLPAISCSCPRRKGHCSNSWKVWLS